MKNVFLLLLLLGFANGQVEVQRLKNQAEERREKARQEAKAQNLPAPAIIDA